MLILSLKSFTKKKKQSNKFHELAQFPEEAKNHPHLLKTTLIINHQFDLTTHSTLLIYASVPLQPIFFPPFNLAVIKSKKKPKSNMQ
jgi:hypothetical protein